MGFEIPESKCEQCLEEWMHQGSEFWGVGLFKEAWLERGKNADTQGPCNGTYRFIVAMRSIPTEPPETMKWKTPNIISRGCPLKPSRSSRVEREADCGWQFHGNEIIPAVDKTLSRTASGLLKIQWNCSFRSSRCSQVISNAPAHPAIELKSECRKNDDTSSYSLSGAYHRSTVWSTLQTLFEICTLSLWI